MAEPNYRRDGGVLPPFASVWGCVREALPALSPAQRISVPDAAAKYRIVDAPGYRGPWRNEIAMPMVEPATMMTSRRYAGVIFVGPARTLKTDALVVNVAAHRIVAQPRDLRVIHMTETTAREFSRGTLDKLIRSSPELRSRQISDHTFEKQFAGGMRLTIGWPVIGHLSGVTLPDILLTDFDRMPEDVGGEGDPFALAMKRTETVGSTAKAMAESSPGRPITEEDWSPSTPHEPPPTTGILSWYAQGTRGRLYWPCPRCEKLYQPMFGYLKYPVGAPPVEAGEQARMQCPHCGELTAPELKSELSRASSWLHEAADDGIGGYLRGLTTIEGNVRPSALASYWMFGPAAVFQSWSKLVATYLEAEETYRRTGDEKKLQVTVNVDQGDAYRPRAMGTASLLTAAELRKRVVKGIGDRDARLVPSNTRFVTLQVDVQANRFVVQADSWAEQLERHLVDRFELFQPSDGTERAIDPARYSADWDCLFDLIERTYEVADQGYELVPAFVVIDSGGAPGVTANAYKFWRRARKRGLGERIMLVRGNHVKNGVPEAQRRAYVSYPERSGAETGKKARLDIPVIWVGTDALKDEISAALTRDEVGEGSYNVLDRVDARVFDELAAERRTEKGWEKRPGVIRNEALDLAVYGKAVVIVKGGEKIDWASPVDWASPMETNVYARRIEGFVRAETPTEVEVPASAPDTRSSSWLGGRRRGYLSRG